MEHLIGRTLTDCQKELESKNIKYTVVSNNHNVNGDTVLVTNVKVLQDNSVILTTGEFIFNLKD